MNRRKFLRNALTAAVAAPFGAPAMGASRPLAAPLNLAFVGTGLMGGANMRIFLRQHGQRCAAVCDVDAKYGEKNILKFAPDARRFVDYREMFDKMADKLDGVVVCKPDNSHFIKCFSN